MRLVLKPDLKRGVMMDPPLMIRICWIFTGLSKVISLMIDWFALSWAILSQNKKETKEVRSNGEAPYLLVEESDLPDFEELDCQNSCK